jgi:hypothetical protein
MAAINIQRSFWACSHTDEITRCAKCNLIYCGKCHDRSSKKTRFPPAGAAICCPACGERIAIKIGPGKDIRATADLPFNY